MVCMELGKYCKSIVGVDLSEKMIKVAQRLLKEKQSTNVSFKILDLTTNKVKDDGLFLALGTQISVKDTGSAATSGNFWVEVMFAQGGV